MRISEHEADLEDLLPHLEAEHAAATDPDLQAAVWQLIDAIERYLLARHDPSRRG